MKHFNLMMFVILLCICGTVTSQTVRPVSELLEILSQNHMGSVTDVFSLEEIQIIKNHFADTTFPSSSENALETIRYSSSQTVTMFQACDIDPGNLSSIEVLANSPIVEFPGAGAPSRGLLPGQNDFIIIDNSNTIWNRDMGPPPIDFQEIGELSGVPPGHSVTGIEILPGRVDQLFGMTTNGVNESQLIIIDVPSMSATPVGGNNGLILPIALARDGNNNLITGDIDDDITYRVNPTTGLVTPLGSLGYDANFGQGWFYDESTGMIISLAYNSTIGDSEMRTVDPVTGLSTSLGTIQPGTVQQFGWGAAYDRDLLGVGDSIIDGFNFYPNPASDMVNLIADDRIETAEVYTVLGQKILKQSIKAHRSEIDISQLSEGTYILKVSTVNGIAAFILIKQ
jgi:hypothetical protein